MAACAKRDAAPPPASVAQAPPPVIAGDTSIFAPPDSAEPAEDLELDSVPPISREGESSGYIARMFQERVGGVPGMGWQLGPAFLAAERHPRLWIFSADSALGTASFRRVAGPRERARIAKRAQVACDGEGPVGIYALGEAVTTPYDRAFFVSAPIPGLRIGMARVAMSDSEKAEAHARLPADSGVVAASYLDEAFTVAGSPAVFSIDAAYDSTGDLIASALILRDHGRIVGDETRTAAEYLCDGCGAPRRSDGINALFLVINAYTLPGFAWPLLYLDSSTMEGRALSFATFTPEGAFEEYRQYEYVVTCIIGEGR